MADDTGAILVELQRRRVVDWEDPETARAAVEAMLLAAFGEEDTAKARALE